MTDKEIIIGLRKALKWYANPNHYIKHDDTTENFCFDEFCRDICQNEDSEFYGEQGEIARQALKNYE